MYINKKRRDQSEIGTLYGRSLDEIPDIKDQRNVSERHKHPDYPWLQHITDWAAVGKLYFRKTQSDVKNHILKQYFAQLNFHIYDKLEWRNVPVYWRWHKQKVHTNMYVEFLLLRSTKPHTFISGHTVDGFNCMGGPKNEFQSIGELCNWLTSKWEHGPAHIVPITNLKKSIDSVTYTNEEVLDTCYSPPIHYLRRLYSTTQSL